MARLTLPLGKVISGLGDRYRIKTCEIDDEAITQEKLAPGVGGGSGGSVWRDGSGAPSNGLGSNGDYYLDNATGDVYHKAAGVYTVVTNIEGPDGAAGIDGADGQNGSDGADGSNGADGTNGNDGADGADGVGVPVGGLSGDQLVKLSGIDFDTTWITPPDLTSLPTADEKAALDAANLPSALNALATLADIVSTLPGGSDTQVQFNDADAFGGDAGLTYNKTTNVLSSVAVEVSDHFSVGPSPPASGQIRLDIGDGIWGRGTDDHRLLSSDGDRLILGGLGGAEPSIVPTVVGGMNFYGSSAFDASQPFSVMANSDMSLFSPDSISAIGGNAHKDSGYIDFLISYWDGAQSRREDMTLQLVNTGHPVPTTEFQMAFYDLNGNSLGLLHLDRVLNMYPDTDNTGSLGISGKTWKEGHFGDFIAFGPSPALDGGRLRLGNSEAVSWRKSTADGDEQLTLDDHGLVSSAPFVPSTDNYGSLGLADRRFDWLYSMHGQFSSYVELGSSLVAQSGWLRGRWGDVLLSARNDSDTDDLALLQAGYVAGDPNGLISYASGFGARNNFELQGVSASLQASVGGQYGPQLQFGVQAATAEEVSRTSRILLSASEWESGAPVSFSGSIELRGSENESGYGELKISAGDGAILYLDHLALYPRYASLPLDISLGASSYPFKDLYFTPPTSDPHITNQVWSNLGALQMSVP